MVRNKSVQLSIIPTYLCNYNCQYCYLGDLRKNKQLLPLNILKKRLKELTTEYDIKQISIYGGEISLLNKDYLDKLIEIIKEYRFSITTNLSNSWLVDYCTQHDIHISISLNEERDHYPETLEKLLTMDKTDNMDLTVVVLPSLLKKSPKELSQFYEKIGLNVFFLQYHPSTYSNMVYNISEQHFSDFLRGMLLEHKKGNYSFSIDNVKILKDKDYCPTMDTFLFINPYGKFSSVEYKGDFEYPIEFNNLKEWKQSCEKERQWYFNRCCLCEFYNKCKAEHLVNIERKECSGLYSLMKDINTLI